MTTELRPLGALCNLNCAYCYQNPQRKTHKLIDTYNIKAMKCAVDREGGPFTLFGGEPLLVNKKDLEKLFAWGFVRWGRCSIQSNGVLIDDSHIQMFKKYNVGVGISIDGPSEFNFARSCGSSDGTKRATAATETAIKRLCDDGIAPSLIVTLHRLNAVSERLPTMHNWLHSLEKIGITSIRLHILEVENQSVRENYALSTQENIDAFLSFLKLEKELKYLQFDLFADMRNQLLGKDNRTTCVWNACDSLTTRAVRGVEGNGQRSNCGRTNKEGINFLKSEKEGFERYISLYSTPQEYGGCNNCRFFVMCKGQCPGTALDGDWRNRTEYCEVWKAIFSALESELINQGLKPISNDHVLRNKVANLMCENWLLGKNSYMCELIKRI